MSATRFTVSSRATGTRRSVVVWVYDTREEMLAAANAFRPGSADADTGAICHGLEGVAPPPEHRRVLAIVRLHRGQLSAETISHEMTHAAAQIYCFDLVRRYSSALAHIHAGNEPLAYLVGELTGRTYENLHRLGYY